MARPSKGANPYAKKLTDPRWQKRRLEIFERDGFACQLCGDTESTLHVHHKHYLPVYDKDTNPDDWAEISTFDEPWMADDAALVTLCKDCHADETSGLKDVMGRINRTLRESFSSFELEDLLFAIMAVERASGGYGTKDRARRRRNKNAE